MADLGELKIPAPMRAVAGTIIALTDEVCADLLDEEYASLARRAVAKLARKRPSPIQSGRAPTWAGAVVYALGQVNFLFDSSTKPYATADDLATAFGVAKSTLGAKAKQVRDLTKMDYGTPEFLRKDMVDASPMIWFIQVDGLIVDARELPPQIQAQAFKLGIIPYIPALGRDGTTEWLSGVGGPLSGLMMGPDRRVDEGSQVMSVSLAEHRLGGLRWIVLAGPDREAFRALGEHVRNELAPPDETWPMLPRLRQHVSAPPGRDHLASVRRATAERHGQEWAELAAFAAGAAMPDGVRSDPAPGGQGLTMLCTLVADLTAGQATIAERGGGPITIPLADLAAGSPPA